MKQTFVVPIYSNNSSKYITKIVRAPQSSRRIARVYAQSLNGEDIFTDDDLLGISIEEKTVIPINFPVTAMCSQYFKKEYMYIAGLGSLYSHLPSNVKAIDVNSICSGSKITIEYKTRVSNFVLVFECDDEPITQQYTYHIHDIALSYPDRFRGGLEDRYSKVKFNIQLLQKPISFLVKPLIYGNGSIVNYYHVFKEAYLSNTSNEYVCSFFEYLQKGLISIETGDNFRIDNLHTAIVNPMANLSMSDVEIGVKTQSLNINGYVQFYKTQESNLHENPPADYPFLSAGYQIIIKTLKQ